MKSVGSVKRAVVAALLIGGIVTGFAPQLPVVHATTPPTVPPPLPPDSQYAYYSAQGNGLYQVDLFNAPALVPNPTALTYTTAQTAVSVPAGATTSTLQATPGGSANTAQIDNEDGQSIGITLQSVGGAPANQVTGQSTSDYGSSFTGVSSATNLTVARTSGGYNLDLAFNGTVLPSSVSATFAVQVPSGSTLTTAPDGAPIVQRPIQECGDAGCITVLQSDFLFGAPVATDSTNNPLTAFGSQPATVQMISGTNTLQVSVPALSSHQLHAPFHVVVPVITAYHSLRTGIAATTSSCASGTGAPLTDMAVGVSGGCTYNGLLYFNTTSLRAYWQIQSATLHLYTPSAAYSSAATGVTVYPAVPPASYTVSGSTWDPDPMAPPSASTAPQVPSGTAGIAENAGASGGWHSWDVTSALTSWLQNRTANNGGLVLTRGGAPVVFSSPIGANPDGYQDAPYLQITYTLPPLPPAGYLASPDAAPPPSNPLPDGSTGFNAYGVGGGIVSGATGDPDKSGDTTVSTVSKNLGARYVRLAVNLQCASTTTWTTAAQPYGTSIWTLLNNTFATGLIPVVDFAQPGGCQYGSVNWKSVFQDFAKNYNSQNYPQQHPGSYVYFEIGNEWNLKGSANIPLVQYPTFYGQAASGLYSTLITSTSHFTILIGGILAPRASNSQSTCSTAVDNITPDSITTIINNTAGGSFNVPTSYQGIALHPYGYTKREISFALNGSIDLIEFGFLNYLTSQFDNASGGTFPMTYQSCADIDATTNAWTQITTSSGSKPAIMFTEVNWDSQPYLDHYKSNTFTVSDQSSYNRAERFSAEPMRSYLVDFYSWMYNSTWANTNSSRVRAFIHRGADYYNQPPQGQSPVPEVTYSLLGLYHSSPPSQHVKRTASLNSCPYHRDWKSDPQGDAQAAQKIYGISDDFKNMHNASCYPGVIAIPLP